MYLACLTISDCLSSGSLTSVNFTGMRSFNFKTSPLTGQYIVLSGLFRAAGLACGVFTGIQKLGRLLSRPFVMLDTELVLAFSFSFACEGVTMFFSVLKKAWSFLSSSAAVFSCDSSFNHKFTIWFISSLDKSSFLWGFTGLLRTLVTIYLLIKKTVNKEKIMKI